MKHNIVELLVGKFRELDKKFKSQYTLNDEFDEQLSVLKAAAWFMQIRSFLIGFLAEHEDHTEIFRELFAGLQSPDPYTRYCIVSSLEFFQTPNPIPWLIPALKDGDLQVRLAAVRAVSASSESLQDFSALDPLMERLNDNEARVRSQVALALWRLKNLKAVEPLIQRLKIENDKDVQLTLDNSLMFLTGKRFFFGLIGGNYKRWSKWWEKEKKKTLTR